jgi:hypothetical protein
MRRRSILIAPLVLAVLSIGLPQIATAEDQPVDVASLDRKIERAQAHVDRWYARIARWYERIDRASTRLERLETIVSSSAGGPDAVLRRAVPRGEQPTYLLAEAARDLRAILTDPRARHVQAELDTWSAFLAELVHARERALRPPPAEGDGISGGAELAPGQPVTYEAWAGAFLGRLGAPTCSENLLIVVTWETAESTAAAFNPLATTHDMPGATDMNTVGVKDYKSVEQGLDASRDTLLLGAESYGYGAIVDNLRGCSSAEATAQAINASAWCRGCVGGTYITGLLPIVRTSYSEHAGRLVSTAA